MSTTFAVPAALQEFLGHRQTKVEAFSVLSLGVLLTVIYAALFLGFIGHANYLDSGLPTWRLVVGVLLASDIFFGAVANFSRGTNAHYSGAEDSKKRWIFIVAHWHISILCWLWHPEDMDALTFCAGLNLFTLLCAAFVNTQRDYPNALQRFIGGATMVSSSFLLVSLAVRPELGGRLPQELWPVCFVFHVKVMYAFAVDHYGGQTGSVAKKE